MASVLTAVMALSTAVVGIGCGSTEKGYDLYIYNTKSEIADGI